MHVAHLLIFIIIIGVFIPQTEASVSASFINGIRAFLNEMTQSYTIHNVTKEEIAANSNDHVNLLSRVKRADQPTCDEEQLMLFLAQIQVTNPESIVNLCTVNELDATCKQTSSDLAAIEDYLKTCAMPTGRNLYFQLTKGVAEFVDIMCEKDRPLRHEFLQHYPCLKSIHNEFENCFGPADWTEDEKHRDICCAYKQVADCYFLKAAAVCGKPAASAIRKVLIKIINTVITVHCTILTQPCVEEVVYNNAMQLQPSKEMAILVIILCDVAHKSNQYLHLR